MSADAHPLNVQQLFYSTEHSCSSKHGASCLPLHTESFITRRYGRLTHKMHTNFALLRGYSRCQRPPAFAPACPGTLLGHSEHASCDRRMPCCACCAYCAAHATLCCAVLCRLPRLPQQLPSVVGLVVARPVAGDGRRNQVLLPGGVRSQLLFWGHAIARWMVALQSGTSGLGQFSLNHTGPPNLLAPAVLGSNSAVCGWCHQQTQAAGNCCIPIPPFLGK